MKVLITCPPMLRLMSEFKAAFDSANVQVDCPNIVQTLSEEELLRIVPGFDGWIIGDDPATRAVLSAGKSGRLKAAVKWGVGVDNVDFPAASDLNLPVVNTPGVFGREVADVAMCYVTGLARELFEINREVRDKNGWPKPAGISLAEKTAAIVGFGDIGQQTARRLLATDMRVIVYDPACPPADKLPVETALWPNRLNEADFLIFTCPLNSKTRGMFSFDTLDLLKPGVRIVNVGRGPVVSEAALVRGLESGIVHSAALEVFEIEPLPSDSRLRQFPQVLFGSHNASNTVDAVRRVSRLAIDLLFKELGLKRPVGDEQ
jgi:D-3-phosphoglycerate dehydrogenase